MAETATRLHTFRGLWRSGEAVRTGDVMVVGRWSFSALIDHISGPQTQPNFGEHWARFWRPTDGVAQPSLPAPPVAAAPQSAAKVPVALEPRSPPPAPAVAAAASEIPDDSDVGMPNVAMSLSWLKRMVALLAPREWVLEQLEGLERALIARLSQSYHHADDIAAEAWRRRAAVLGADGEADAREAEIRITREMLRLVRKRDRGETWTTVEAARAGILDSIEHELARIDEAEAGLRIATPKDPLADRHWPRIGQ